MDAQVAVVGGGVMGLATGHALLHMGVDHVVLERFDVGHANGSSHGATRIFRYLYDDPLYVRMAQAAKPLWDELGTLEMTGGIQIDDPEVLERHATAMASCGAATEMADPARFPWIAAAGRPVMYVPDLGVISADETLRLLATNVVSGCLVEAIEPTNGGVRLSTSSGVVSARTCVVAAGAWVRRFVDVPVRVTREQVLYFAADTSVMLPFVHGVGKWIYSIPKDGRVKVAEHHTGADCDPDDRSFGLDVEGAERVRAYVREHLPFVDPEPVGFETCLYTSTRDQDFIIDREGPVVVVSPCSGHGFKFAPFIGEIAASLATDKTPPMQIERFSRRRERERVRRSR